MDDLQNTWGRFIVPEEQTKVRATHHQKSASSLNKLKGLVNATAAPFTFINTYASGSHAIQWCINQASDLNIHHLLFACGSYVSGDMNSHLPKLSSSVLFDNHGRINTDTVHDMALKHTVPFPYHIPNVDTLTNQQLGILEKKILDEIHRRCLLARMEGAPIKSIFLELMLQCNGAIFVR